MLRPITMILLKEKPMSGSEIAEEIESYAEWKPSPGSIYPLLSSLQEEGLITPNEGDDPNLKRFSITEKGLEELRLHTHHEHEIRSRNKNMRKIYWRLIRSMSENFYESYLALIDSIEETYEHEDNVVQLKAIMDNAVKEIEELRK